MTKQKPNQSNLLSVRILPPTRFGKGDKVECNVFGKWVCCKVLKKRRGCFLLEDLVNCGRVVAFEDCPSIIREFEEDCLVNFRQFLADNNDFHEYSKPCICSQPTCQVLRFDTRTRLSDTDIIHIYGVFCDASNEDDDQFFERAVALENFIYYRLYEGVVFDFQEEKDRSPVQMKVFHRNRNNHLITSPNPTESILFVPC